jgi:transcriptional/translational regulatory protein YebC/TACO1
MKEERYDWLCGRCCICVVLCCVVQVYCAVEELVRIRDILSSKGFATKRVMILNIPNQINELPDEETAESLRKLIDAFEEVDEVVTVTHNAGTEEDEYAEE